MNTKKIDESIKPIVDKFNEVLKKDWVPGINDKSFGNVGLTFERELGKKPDTTFFPDYYGIEVKCTTINSRYPVYLFSAAFDGPTYPEIERIIEKYGTYDYFYKNKKVLYTKVSFKEKTLVNSKWYFQFSKDKDKIFLNVYDLDKNLIEKKSFIYIKTLYNHLMIKLQKLAMVYALQKNINGKKHFKYYKIDIYEMKEFGKFIYLLENGYITASLVSRLGRSGNDAGRYRNKNLAFAIDKEKLYFLFDRLYYYNSRTGKEIIN